MCGSVSTRIRFPSQADSTCPQKVSVEPCDGDYSIVDLTRTTFAKPFGITLLYGLLCRLREEGEAVRVLIPNSDVATYLWRMNLHEPFANDPGVVFEPNLGGFSLTRWLQPKQLLELTSVDAGSDDDAIAAETRIWEIIAARAAQYAPLEDQIRTAVVELISNVERHSRTGRASVIGQTFKDCVRIAVGDVGIGVRSSLERVHNLEAMSDDEVLRFATQPGVTGSVFGGGTGLSTIVDAIRENGRAVHLASGQGVYSVLRTGEHGHQTGFVVPGTVVEVVFERPGG
jgi:hypothetical protein